MSKPPDENAPDDFEAVRRIVETLKSFDVNDQERIIRWAKEKLELPLSSQVPAQEKQKVSTAPYQKHAPNIKTFVDEKNPASDTHFATTVAYYYRFEASEAERKDSISQDDLKEACRQTDRRRIKHPPQTLNNAYKEGLLDKTGERGRYKINTVGENLVAMTLPGGKAKKPTSGKRASKAIKKVVPKKAKMPKSTKRK